MFSPSRIALLSFSVCAAFLLAPPHLGHTASAPTHESAPAPEAQIIAIVNGQVLTQRDVEDRARLFVLSTGLPISPDVMSHMRGQIIHQLINERLKMQEMLSRHINIEPEQIAAAITNIEARNGMPQNALRNRLKSDGVSLTTLIDQIRVQIGWMQVLREELGVRNRVTPEQISQRERALQAESGRPQYMVSEIFVPVSDPRHDDVELTFTKEIIHQLREGAPFPIVAAQFSQEQSALDGGARGWVQEDNIEPQVLSIIKQMPDGAISNPIKVPGGYIIATVHGRRVVGKQLGTIIGIRQAFIPFTSTLDPSNPTDQQKLALQKATSASQSLHSCDAVEALNRSYGNTRPSDPGPQVLERLAPQMQAALSKLPIGRATHPLVATDGIALLMVCSRNQRNLAQQTPGQIADQMMNERVEQAAQQLQRALQRRAVIQIRPSAHTVLQHG